MARTLVSDTRVCSAETLLGGTGVRELRSGTHWIVTVEIRRRLPHQYSEGKWLFVTFHLHGSLPHARYTVHPQQVFRKSFPVDLGYYFLNSLLPKMILTLPMALISWGLRYVVPRGLHTWVAGMPMPGRLAAALVVGEFGFYWGHRWTHEIPLLWRFHAIHHSAEEIDWLVNIRAHPFDIVFVRLCGFVPMYALGLAQPLMGKRLDVVPLLVMLIATLWGFFIHANLRWRFGWLGLLVYTPAFHHWPTPTTSTSTRTTLRCCP